MNTTRSMLLADTPLTVLGCAGSQSAHTLLLVSAAADVAITPECLHQRVPGRCSRDC